MVKENPFGVGSIAMYSNLIYSSKPDPDVCRNVDPNLLKRMYLDSLSPTQKIVFALENYIEKEINTSLTSSHL